VNAEFNWWLLIVGLVLGAALTWLVMAESTRRDADITESEQRGEALWIASMLSSSDRATDTTGVEEILRLHREYLAAPPPDELAEPGIDAAQPAEGAEAAEAEEAPIAHEPDAADLPDPVVAPSTEGPEERP
jgi:hypothetical protein